MGTKIHVETLNVMTYIWNVIILNKISEVKMATTSSSGAGVKKAVWLVDKSHTKIQFSARHMIISEVTGHFTDYELTMKASDSFEDAEIEFDVNIASIDTGIKDRDNHLKSPDFFDAEKFPKMIFKSKKIQKINDEKFKLTGDFTIKDIVKTIDLDVTYGGTIKDPWGNTRAGFRIQGAVNRFDYGLKWNALMETGGAVVSKNINITCDVEITKQADSK